MEDAGKTGRIRENLQITAAFPMRYLLTAAATRPPAKEVRPQITCTQSYGTGAALTSTAQLPMAPVLQPPT